LAKSNSRVHGIDDRGNLVLRQRLTRKQLLPVRLTYDWLINQTIAKLFDFRAH
jgi:hypothetical protein